MDKAPCRGRRRCTRFSGLMGAVFEGLRENFTGLDPRFGLPGMPGIIGLKVERVEGIEPSTKAWEAFVLPLNYTRFA